jgi:glutamyl-Q tRNA(Asp) synthetase
LHFGSLIAATASYLSARHQQGQWRVRLDDLDGPRVVDGACEAILTQLQGYGFEWDGPVIYQSQRSSAYQAALSQLNQAGRLYVCTCSRKQIKARQADGAHVYDAHCRPNGRRPDPATLTPADAAWRFQPDQSILHFEDGFQGFQTLTVTDELGDFVVKRADGIFGYHLACAVDDLAMGVTEVVRGEDLLTSSFAQRALMLALGHTPPHYAHHRLAINHEGIKLSKKSRAPAIDVHQARDTLSAALRFLQHPPPRLQTLVGLWDWAVENWEPERLIPSN